MATYSETEIHTAAAKLTELDNDDFGARIETLRRIIGDAEDMIGGEVAAARVNGWSWGQLAPALGTTRQGAQQRYGNA